MNSDLGKLLLRVSIGGLMVFHGISKLYHGHDFIKGMLTSKNLPEYLWLGVPLGEVFAPICILLGVFTRISSLLVAFTMLMTFYLVHGMEGFSLSQTGGLKVELNLFYLLTSLALFFLGSGKYSVYKGNKGIMI
ncbi:DoxX family protein [Apibacter sp. B3706]|nr:DoxX family protein [Apibacter sp. B3919]MXO25569.1 DoxX family membrane protein [Apibacter sp. B3924]MXO26776.1 DoxX family membrane protein [Apibacter sp. B3813]MXO28654.1 DoxX family membrane protein [Apibacter sp. B3913]MXO30608.1 DoxX family membrane protein [Apibacter sp. B3912]MXO32791.1 DoxX family membrane protein [Apibacter sp. B2912]MXO34687.1 DoxX family membrane protein [Apibacter sp. B3883]MXO42209.1 DoxX family membrane protein [Apibacter sp. B3889]MXP01938.1 DoxX family m